MRAGLVVFIFQVFSRHFGFAADWENWGENAKFKMAAYTTDALAPLNPPAMQATSGSHSVTWCFLKETNMK